MVDKQPGNVDKFNGLTPQKRHMWISYPQGVWIDLSSYPQPANHVENLSTAIVDNCLPA